MCPVINSKIEIRNPKQIEKIQIENPKVYDLEDRTYQFAADCRNFIKRVTRTISNMDDCKQLSRSSGSVAANYIEANEALSKKDFRMRIKICRKESKESALWLNLLDIDDSDLSARRNELKDEANQLMKIFGSILRKSE